MGLPPDFVLAGTGGLLDAAIGHEDVSGVVVNLGAETDHGGAVENQSSRADRHPVGG